MTHKKPHPALAGLTNNQWYCHEARQTVFFAAFSKKALQPDDLLAIAKNFVAAAPQLATLFRAFTGKELDDPILRSVLQHTYVKSLAPYPDSWPVDGNDVFTDTARPMFRIHAATLNDAEKPSANGHRTAFFLLSTHALLEGADSALLSRSQGAGHDHLAPPSTHPNIWKKRWQQVQALGLAPLQLLAALAIAPRRIDRGYKSLVLPRDQVRRVAARLGIGQRALLFAATTFALNNHGKGFSKRAISILYADMEGRNAVSAADEFFRYRMIEVGFPARDDFVAFAKIVDQRMQTAEKKDPNGAQALLNAIFAMHRKLKHALPFLYPERIFRFTGFYHLDLSLTPPHRLEGALTADLVEPIYCGTFHPGLNAAVFVPGRHHITVNFTLAHRHLPQTPKVQTLIASLDPVEPR